MASSGPEVRVMPVSHEVRFLLASVESKIIEILNSKENLEWKVIYQMKKSKVK